MHIATTITDHADTVPADTSAATIITSGVLADATRNAIRKTLTDSDDSCEYGAVTAINPETGERHTTTATKGYRSGVAPLGIPDTIVESQTTRNTDTNNEPSAGMTGNYAYKNLIGVHTHPVTEAANTGSVGLSAADVTDDVFVGDHISVKRKPYDVYRAKAAIVFTDDTSKLPIHHTQSHLTTGNDAKSENWIVSNQPYPEQTLLDSRPDKRPWLHLVERNNTGSNMSESDADALHSETLGKTHSGTASEQYQQAKRIIEHTVSELLIPLSP